MRNITLALMTATLAVNVNAWCKGKDSGCGGNLAEGDGDCDSAKECRKGLKCGKNNCFRGKGTSFEWDDDCCYDPRKNTYKQRLLNPWIIAIRNSKAAARRLAAGKAAARRRRAAHKKRMVAARRRKFHRHHQNIFSLNIRNKKTWMNYRRANVRHARNSNKLRAHRNKMVAKYFAARNTAGRWANIRKARRSAMVKSKGVMYAKRRTAAAWSKKEAYLNRVRIAKSRHHTAMVKRQGSFKRWGRQTVLKALRNRSAWNRKWAGIAAKAAKANRAAVAAWKKANGNKRAAWAAYHVANRSQQKALKAYRWAIGNLRKAHSRRAYWLARARVAHHALVHFVRSGAGRGYFH